MLHTTFYFLCKRTSRIYNIGIDLYIFNCLEILYNMYYIYYITIITVLNKLYNIYTYNKLYV